MTTCPTPKKLRFGSKLTAKIALANTELAAKSNRHSASNRRESRIYHCPCGAWHLTSTKRSGR